MTPLAWILLVAAVLATAAALLGRNKLRAAEEKLRGCESDNGALNAKVFKLEDDLTAALEERNLFRGQMKDAIEERDICREELAVRFATVHTLHGAIATPAGSYVAPWFSAMWTAHGLEDIGIQDIRQGRT